jgi:two-component system chemotaxis response regulator CheB
VRVVVVDDSNVVRRVLAGVIEREQGVTLVATAANGREALLVLEGAQPDVVVLDIEMPVMDGIETLREMKKRWPRLPVIMFSTLTEHGAAVTLDALAEGADDYLIKPVTNRGPAGAYDAVSEQLVPLLRSWGGIARSRAFQDARAQRADLLPPRPPAHMPPALGRRALGPSALGPAILALPPLRPVTKRAPVPKEGAAVPPPAAPKATSQVVAVVIGASTGGPNALGIVVPSLPADLRVPVFVVQHMPPTFTRLFAERLDRQSGLEVHEAVSGTVAKPGHLYVAAGGAHMVVSRCRREVVIQVDDGPPENSCKPSVDVLFRSAATTWGPGVLGVVLTGMGQDGLAGVRSIVSAGGEVIAQDQASSVVWGMPGAVARAGLAAEVATIADIAGSIVKRTNQGTSRRTASRGRRGQGERA